MSLLKIRLFGSPQISLDEKQLKFDRRKTLALLAYLAASNPASRASSFTLLFPASRETLAALLWEDCTQEQAASYLRQALWDFHKTAGEGWIVREGTAIGLANRGELSVDVLAFEDLLRTWKTSPKDDSTGLDLLHQAVALYQEDFLAGFTLRDSPEFDAWQTLRAEGLRLALAEALETLIHLQAARGDYAGALAGTRRWLALDELNESAQREMMRLLAENGQRSAALRQYETCQRILQEQLGVAPEQATVQLFQQISTRRSAAVSRQEENSHVPIRPAPRAPVPVFLPTQTTPFLGRETELARIKELLSSADCRLITLLGPGGSGKTRLAIQAAGQSIGYPHHLNFPHGIYFCALAGASNPAEAVRAIAAALKLEFRVDFGSVLKAEQAQAQLLEYLAEKRILLVLDNLEQIADCSVLLAGILATAPAGKLIVTSRVRLNLPEEWILEVGGLPIPEEIHGSADSDHMAAATQYAAVQLFLKGAERNCGFQPTVQDWPAVTRIVRLVEGLPLGVELASAWVKILSCQEIADEMSRSLDFLQNNRPGLPERQRSLRAVFEHSWKLLSDSERSIFQKLSIFRGGFTREAAYEVAGASLALLLSFADQSLLRRVASSRFDLHELLKQYAGEKLAGDPQAQAGAHERHARHYSGWLRRKAQGLKGSDQMAVLFTLRWEKQNLRQAWRWLIEHRKYADLEQVLPDVILFFEMDGDLTFASQLMHAVVNSLRSENQAAEGADTKGLLGLSLAGIRHFERELYHSASAFSIQRESLTLGRSLPTSLTKAYIYMLLSSGPGTLSVQEQLKLCQESIQTFENASDPWGAALSTLILADSLNFGRIDAGQVRQAYQKSLDLFTQLGNDWGRALCFFGLAMVAAPTGQMEEACRLLQHSLAIYLRLDNMNRVIDTRHTLGEIHAQMGETSLARQFFTANKIYFEEVGMHEQSRYYYERLARLNLLPAS